jgi:hypothetical protein
MARARLSHFKKSTCSQEGEIKTLTSMELSSAVIVLLVIAQSDASSEQSRLL